ncbi:MAG: potassium channel family protein [Comamonadaceae bacterium]|nr:potassium channel family protein [Comamonadaceae bacterium]
MATGFLHYEVLRGLNNRLPQVALPDRFKLLVVIAVAFVAHALEILLYGLVVYWLVGHQDAGHLVGASGPLLSACLYFSAETYTSLGFGDVTPDRPDPPAGRCGGAQRAAAHRLDGIVHLHLDGAVLERATAEAGRRHP